MADPIVYGIVKDIKALDEFISLVEQGRDNATEQGLHDSLTQDLTDMLNEREALYAKLEVKI